MAGRAPARRSPVLLREQDQHGQTAMLDLTALAAILEASALRHRHLCPRQVLGVRMGLYAGELLGIELPQHDKRLLAIVETDGCASDAISEATNCWVGRRTMRVQYLGKVAATFVDTASGRALRIVPRLDVRARARDYAPAEPSKWRAQLVGYQLMPARELLDAQPVELLTPLEELLSRPGTKAICSVCGEEVINRREVLREGIVRCGACAGLGYYRRIERSRA